MGKIIWLASYPKSGNTWVRAFLHNLLRDPPEGYDINRISDFTIGDADVPWYTPFIGRPPGDWSREEVARVRPRAHEAMTRAYPDSVFVKTHNALVADQFGPLIPLELTAGAIYVVRNPLDVAVSYGHHLGRSIDDIVDLLNSSDTGNPNTTITVYQILRSWSEHVQSWTGRPHPALHVVRYEDLLEKPEPSFAALARFLGLKPPAHRLRRAVEHASFRELQRREAAGGFKERSSVAERFFREGRSGQWREALTPAQVKRIVDAHREQMARFGYLID
jgi:Sulfotransferase domain